MNIFKNKFFLLGNLAFILLAIPVILFVLKSQTTNRSSAAPTTTITFSRPNLETDQCTNVTTDIALDPGQNVVNTLDLHLKWDPTKFNVSFTANPNGFQQVIGGPTVINGTLDVILQNSDVTKAIVTKTIVGTLTIKPLAPTGGAPIPLTIDPATQVRSLSSADGAQENVFNAAGSPPLLIAITPQVCSGTSTTPTVTLSPSPTLAVTPSDTPTPTPAIVNNPPTCIDLTASVSSGSAPLSVTLTADGNDSDGTVAKATFNFGDGTVQDVTNGMGTASVSAQLSHTYTVGGTYQSTVTFTDNGGALSTACTQDIAVTGTSATSTPTPVLATPTTTASGGGILATDTPTATPTLAKPGGVSSTLTVIGGIIIAIFAGAFLLAL